ncbi:MAG TPA: hypothetical protein VFG69_10160, partial [Nannocystaceae bacterium]|nr:hypothetical protein [Nannocystaceae bacterium]
EGAEAEYEARLAGAPEGWDLWASSLATLRAMPLAAPLWIRRSYMRLAPVVDKTGGELARVIDEIWRVPPAMLGTYVHAQLDGYVNAVYRSVKALRAGDALAHRLDAAASIEPMLAAAFAMHDRRLAPLAKYLRGELEHFPLTGLGRSADEILADVLAILDRGDLDAQQRLLGELEALARRSGHGAALDASPGKDRWVLSYRP